MSGKDTDIVGRGRGDRLIKERIHDPYLSREKLPEPTVCPECRAVFTEGRWQWQSSVAEDANETLCPACRRIREKVPAGILTLSGTASVADYQTALRSVAYRNTSATPTFQFRTVVFKASDGTAIGSASRQVDVVNPTLLGSGDFDFDSAISKATETGFTRRT